jgi:hypothetical protein
MLDGNFAMSGIVTSDSFSETILDSLALPWISQVRTYSTSLQMCKIALFATARNEAYIKRSGSGPQSVIAGTSKKSFVIAR